MKALLKPDRLNWGDTVGLIAPASPPPDPAAIDRALAALEQLGFKPKPGKNVRARHGFLAGSDRERTADLMAMFTDKKVKAIFCLRGGHGVTRLLDRLDYAVIRRHPKILAGYSDITALHGALLKQAGLVSFHSPMWNGALADPQVPPFTRAAFFRVLMEAKPGGSICAGYTGKTISVLRAGVAEGRLVGGNLSLICASLGTPYVPSYQGKILFLEETGERPYRLDRMLTQLWHAGILAQVAGVAVGINQDCEAAGSPGTEYRQTAGEVVRERLAALRVPVVTGLPFGHGDWNATLAVGIRARLDANQGDLSLIESAVK